MNSTKWRLLLWHLIRAVDTGLHDDLGIEEVRHHALEGGIGRFLFEHFSEGLNIDAFPPDVLAEIGRKFVHVARQAEHHGDFGVHHRGISLLMAYTFECLHASAVDEAEAHDRAHGRSSVA